VGLRKKIDHTLKKTLKRFFSRVALKKLWLWYNVARINTTDKVLYGRAMIPSKDINATKNPFLELKISTSHLPHDVQRGLSMWMDPSWTQAEYLLKFEQEGYIDPVTGWAINSRAQLIGESLGFSAAPHVRKPSWWGMRFNRNPVIELDKIISLRDTGEENYFHFYNDVISKVFFLRDHGVVLSDYTLVVSARAWQKPYFVWFVQNSWLKELRFFVQDREWVFFKSAVFCKPFTHTKRYLDELVAIAGASNVAERRLFLTRSSSTLRYISNEDEVRSLMSEFGFVMIDPGKLPPKEQFDLFCGATHVVAVHGAAITNIIFRNGKPLSLLEIVHPFRYVPFHYIMLAAMYGYSYSALLGYKSGGGGFRVDIDELRKQVKNLIR